MFGVNIFHTTLTVAIIMLAVPVGIGIGIDKLLLKRQKTKIYLWGIKIWLKLDSINIPDIANLVIRRVIAVLQQFVISADNWKKAIPKLVLLSVILTLAMMYIGSMVEFMIIYNGKHIGFMEANLRTIIRCVAISLIFDIITIHATYYILLYGINANWRKRFKLISMDIIVALICAIGCLSVLVSTGDIVINWKAVNDDVYRLDEKRLVVKKRDENVSSGQKPSGLSAPSSPLGLSAPSSPSGLSVPSSPSGLSAPSSPSGLKVDPSWNEVCDNTEHEKLRGDESNGKYWVTDSDGIKLFKIDPRYDEAGVPSWSYLSTKIEILDYEELRIFVGGVIGEATFWNSLQYVKNCFQGRAMIPYWMIGYAGSTLIPTLLYCCAICIGILAKWVLIASRFGMRQILERATEPTDVKEFAPFTLIGIVCGIALTILTAIARLIEVAMPIKIIDF